MLKVLVLAAGRSLRLKPIEDKNSLVFLGKSLLQHQLQQLMSIGLEEIIVVARDQNLLKASLESSTLKKIKMVEQEDFEGMAGAILAAKKCIKKNDALLVVNANDVLSDEAFIKIIKKIQVSKSDGLLLAKKVRSYFPGGYVKVKKNGLIESIIEKPDEGKEPSDLVNIVVHYHRDAAMLMETLQKTSSQRDDRYEVALSHIFRSGKKYEAVLYDGFWQGLKYPWHVLDLMDYYLETLPEISFKNAKNLAANVEIAPTAVIRGKVVLGEGVRVLDHAVIVGPAYIGRNTIVATNALVRSSHIGENCVIGFGSEIARSYVGNDVWTHTNYIGDSIIGNDVSFGAGCVAGNLRLDEGTIPVMVRGEKIDSGRTKFGLMTGNHVRCGINISFMPGVKIGHGCFIGAGITLSQDVEDGKYVYGKTTLIVKENKAKLTPTQRAKMRKGL